MRWDLKKRLLVLAVGSVLLIAIGLLVTQWVVAFKLDQITHPIRADNYSMSDGAGQSIPPVNFQTADGITLRGWYLPSKNGAAIILQHGYRANSAEMLPAGLMLAAHGYGVLMFDFRGQGKSGGDHVTLGLDETKDTDAALTFLQTQPDVAPDKIGLLGNSMGGATGILATANNLGIQALAVEGVFAELKDEVGVGIQVQTGLPAEPLASIFILFAERTPGYKLSNIAPISRVGEISPRPILIMQGGSDARIPVDSGQRLLKAAKEPKSYWYEPKAPHVGFYDTVRQTYEDKIVGFFDNSLLKTVQSP